MSTTTRNVLIVLGLAGLVYAVPGGDSGLGFVGSLLSILITASFAFLGYRLYRENRVELFSLGERHRGMLYGAIGAIVFIMAARERLFGTPGGALLWFAVLGASAYALVMVYRHYRSYQY